MTRFIAINLPSYDTWRMRLIVTILLCAVLVAMPGPAHAFDLEETLKKTHVQYPGKDDLSVAQGGGMSLSEAIEMIRRRTGGQVISAETRVKGGREVHYIRVLKDGTVKTHTVNGRRR